MSFRWRFQQERWLTLALLLSLGLTGCADTTSVPDRPATSSPSHQSVAAPTETLSPSSTMEPTGLPVSTPTHKLPEPRRTPTVALSPAPTDRQPRDQPPALSPVSPWEGYMPQILAYLNQGGAPNRLEEALDGLVFDEDGTTWRSDARVMISDVTGDGAADVVVDLLHVSEDEHPVYAAITVFTSSDDVFRASSVADIFGARFSGAGVDHAIKVIQDVNGNGTADIVFSYLAPPHGIFTLGSDDDFVRVFQIVEWNGESFERLVEDETAGRPGAAVTNGDGTMEDRNGDGLLELVLTDGEPRGSGVYHPLLRPLRKIWVWDGSSYHLGCVSAQSPPIYRFQAVEDGDDALLCGNHEEALMAYRLAISDESLMGWRPIHFYDPPLSIETASEPDPDERPRLTAYACFRILMLRLARGELREARAAYDGLLKGFPPGSMGHPYVQLATVLWDVYQATLDVGEACDEVVDYATVHEKEILAPLTSEYYTYYAARHGTRRDICPFGKEQ